MNLPTEVLSIAKEASRNNPGDVPRAVEEAYRRVRRLDGYEEIVDTLVRQALQDTIYAARHADSKAIKNQAKYYGGPAGVVVGRSRAVNEVHESAYNYRIAGTVLGALQGNQLPAIAERERATANGHIFNARLCERLNEMVGREQLVKDAVSEKRLWKLFREIQQELAPTA